MPSNKNKMHLFGAYVRPMHYHGETKREENLRLRIRPFHINRLENNTSGMNNAYTAVGF